MHAVCRWMLVLACLPAGRVGAAPPVDFTFGEVTAAVGLEKALHGALNHAVAWGDFDNDGRLDLFLGTFADRGPSPRHGLKEAIPNLLFRQTAAGKFEHFPSPPVELPARCSGAVFADLDNDGDLDLYVSSNTLPNPNPKEPARTAQAQTSHLYRNDGGGKFVDISRECGACPSNLYRARDIGAFDYDNDGLLDLFVVLDPLLHERDKQAAGSRLFRNLGGLRFADVTAKAGLPADLVGLGIAVADLNGDRRPDFFICGADKLFLSAPGNTYKEAESLRPVFRHEPAPRDQDFLTGAVFGDLDRDGDLDLIAGPHPDRLQARVHVWLNGGLKDGVPQFREITKELGIPVLPNKAPHPEIQDFDNDGLPDLYWSVYFAEGTKRQPFLCKGLGVKDGLPRFAVPTVPTFQQESARANSPPAGGLGMVYYVDGPAVDYDGDGRLDFFAGIWPEERSRVFRNETKAGNWLQVRVEGKKMNRMGVGAQVRLYPTGKAGDRTALLGYAEITVNGGYSSGRPALAHFGLGTAETCDVEVMLPSRAEPIILRQAKTNQRILAKEP